jgi:hypothetical protein
MLVLPKHRVKVVTEVRNTVAGGENLVQILESAAVHWTSQ